MLACGVAHVVLDRLFTAVLPAAVIGRLNREDRVYLPEKYAVGRAHPPPRR